MNPGVDGRSLPSSETFRLRRRRKKQHPKRKAAAASKPRGMPIPRPIFWALESPEVLAGGDLGSEVGTGLAEDSVAKLLEKEGEGEDNVETKEVVELEAVETLDELVEMGVGIAERSMLEDGDTPALVVAENAVSVVVVAINSLLKPLLIGGAVGHAVCGPNSTIK